MTESLKPTRDGFGEGLVELGKTNKDVVVLCADLTDSTRASWFKEKFPDRFFSFGVSEQDMFCSASGFALSGKIPFVCTFGVFASGRAWDQIRVSIAYMDLNVKIAGSHGGVTVGADGATHQAIEEISLMRILPNMTVVVPCDALEAKRATIQAAQIPGPVYLRLGRHPAPFITNEQTPFSIGKANVIKEGKDVTIFACGVMVFEAIQAAAILKKENIEAGVVNMHTVKPIDKELILKCARQTKAIVTAEEHTLNGGFGSSIAEVIVENFPVPMEMVGIQDRFGESGKPEELLANLGLRDVDIINAAKRALKRK